MKTKKFISLLVMLGIVTVMLTACGKFSRKNTLSVSFPKTDYITESGVETITNYSHDKVIVRTDGFIEVCGTMQSGDEEHSVQWLYTSDGKPVGSREIQSGQEDYVLLFDNYFNFVPGEGGVVKVEGNTVYYEDTYAVYDVENDMIREITSYSDAQLYMHLKTNELGQTTELEFYDNGGNVFFKGEFTYEEIPVE